MAILSHPQRSNLDKIIVKSNTSDDLAPEHRIADEDILHTINTFMFAGSDSSSLSLTWTLHLLAQNPVLQTRLRNELLSIAPTVPVSELTDEEIQSLYNNISNLPYLHNVMRESLRLIPPVHSSIRVATQDDEIPTMYPVHGKDGKIIEGKRSVTVPKGSFIHVAVEGFNLDKEMWGEDAWEFKFVCSSPSFFILVGSRVFPALIDGMRFLRRCRSSLVYFPTHSHSQLAHE
jgi:cytochrome P450